METNQQNSEPYTNVASTSLDEEIIVTDNERSLATRIISRKPGLSQELVPVIAKFSALGLSERQLEEIVNVPLKGIITSGSNVKLKAFLDAVYHIYGEDYLVPMSKNYGRFKRFIDSARDVEKLRAEITDHESSIDYKSLFFLIDEIGIDQYHNLMERLTGREFRFADTRVFANIKAHSTILELVRESKRTGYDPEAILDFRAGELPSSYYEYEEDILVEE